MLAAAALAVALAQTPVPAADPARIDAIARDGQGRPVETLSVADFELREDGTPQALTGADLVRKPRLIGIYLDEYYVGAARTAIVRETLHRFIDTLGAGDQVVILRPLDSLLKISLTGDKAALHQAIDAFEGRRGDYTPRTDLERNLVAGDHVRADAQRTQSTWSTLNALTLHLGNLAYGRTSVLLVSEIAEPAAARRRGFDGLPTSSSVTRAANRANVSIYAFDPRTAGERAADADEGPNLLQVLADDSDGALISGPDSAAAGLQHMVEDASSYYLLSYRSAHGRDGLFHTIDVGVKRRGVVVRARHGFLAPTPDEIDRATLAVNGLKLPPIKLEPARHASALIRPWFGIARGDNGKIRMTFVWEAAGAVPGDRRVKTAASLDVKAVANGVTLFEGAVRDRTSAVFDVPPGRVTLTSSVQDSAAQTIDSDIRDVLVRDLKGAVALGTPEVFRARTARDLKEIQDDASPVPVASRDFSRAESLVIRVPAYGGTQPPALTATLVSPAGQVMRQLAIEQATASMPTAQIELPLAGLPPGQYRVDIAAKGAAGNAKDSLGFRVAD